MANDEAKEVWKRAIGKRLLESRKAADLSMSEVASRLGCAKQLIFQHEHATSLIQAWQIHRLASIYGVDEYWLFSGKRTAITVGGVPLATSDKELLAIGEAFRKMSTTQRGAEKPDVPSAMLIQTAFLHGPRIAVNTKVSGQGFAWEVPNPALSPKIEPGDIVIVDGAVDPAPNDFALFSLFATREVLLRRYEPAGKGAPYKLTALNKLFPTMVITPEHQPWCLGKAVETIRTFQGVQEPAGHRARQRPSRQPQRA